MSRDKPAAQAVDASRFKIAVAAARFNGALVDALMGRVLTGLAGAGVPCGRVAVVRVPGSNELPLAAKLLIQRHKPDAVIALGVIIKGATRHFELVAEAASSGLMDVSLAAGVPVINGVIAGTAAQAAARCRGRINRGAEFAAAAVSMSALGRALR